tara:strand:- start:13818 stop:14573 length:756 start_codon:yes stop_codon:yes gene_type:complete
VLGIAALGRTNPIKMKELDLSKLSIHDAKLLQYGLNSLGLLNIPNPKGLPGPKTLAAYDSWLESQKEVTMSLEEIEKHGEAPKGNIEIFRNTLVRILESQVGVREVGGNNQGAQIDAYEGATWLNPAGDYAWCASFICWVVREALRATGFQPDWERPRTPGAYAFRDKWGPAQENRGVKVLRGSRVKVLPGDIIVFTFSHVGMARSSADGGAGVPTIEGNTNGSGSREGDGVYRKTRQRSQISAIVRIEEV